MRPPGKEVLDLVHLGEIRAMPGRHGGSLLDEFVALFVRDEPKRLVELWQAAEAKDGLGELVRLAHALAGSCAMLGALEMQESALRLQAAAKAKRREEITGRLEALEASWLRLQQALRKEGLLRP